MMSTTPKARGAPNHAPPPAPGPLGAMKVVTMKLPPQTHEQLRLAAFELQTTLGALSRHVVEEYLRSREDAKRAERKARRGPAAPPPPPPDDPTPPTPQ